VFQVFQVLREEGKKGRREEGKKGRRDSAFELCLVRLLLFPCLEFDRRVSSFHAEGRDSLGFFPQV
jgi:hypothetical protein